MSVFVSSVEGIILERVILGGIIWENVPGYLDLRPRG
jgi:hypothetical protein